MFSVDNEMNLSVTAVPSDVSSACSTLEYLSFGAKIAKTGPADPEIIFSLSDH